MRAVLSPSFSFSFFARKERERTKDVPFPALPGRSRGSSGARLGLGDATRILEDRRSQRGLALLLLRLLRIRLLWSRLVVGLARLQGQSFDQHPDFLGVEHLALEEGLRHCFEKRLVLRQDGP